MTNEERYKILDEISQSALNAKEKLDRNDIWGYNSSLSGIVRAANRGRGEENKVVQSMKKGAVMAIGWCFIAVSVMFGFASLGLTVETGVTQWGKIALAVVSAIMSGISFGAYNVM